MKKAFIFIREALLLFRFWRLFSKTKYQQISPAFAAKENNVIDIRY